MAIATKKPTASKSSIVTVEELKIKVAPTLLALIKEFNTAKESTAAAAVTIKVKEPLILAEMAKMRAQVLKVHGYCKSFSVAGMSCTFTDKFSAIKSENLKEIQTELKEILGDSYKELVKFFRPSISYSLKSEYASPKDLKTIYTEIDAGILEIINEPSGTEPDIALATTIRSLVLETLLEQAKTVAIEPGMDEFLCGISLEVREKVLALLTQQKATLK